MDAKIIGIAAAFAALIAEVGIIVSGPGEPGTALGGTTGTSTPRSASFSLVGTGWWTPDPTAPPAAEPPAAAPPRAEPAAAAPPTWAPPTWEPPAAAPPTWAPPTWEPPAAAPRRAAPPVAELPAAAPPPPPPSELVLRFDNPVTTAFVSITNNANKPAVGCVLRSLAVAGQATIIHYDHSDNFTITGSQEARIPAGRSLGPATGSTFHTTVTCDNGLSTSYDGIY